MPHWRAELKLTLLGPSRVRLERMWKVWRKAMSGKDETEDLLEGQSELLGHHDSWPPVGRKAKRATPRQRTDRASLCSGEEFAGHAILLAGDAFAKDIVEGLSRLMHERGLQSREFPLSAFKLSHHGSHRNLTRSLLEKIRCGRSLISTDGSGHFHPDRRQLGDSPIFAGNSGVALQLSIGHDQALAGIDGRRGRRRVPKLRDLLPRCARRGPHLASTIAVFVCCCDEVGIALTELKRHAIASWGFIPTLDSDLARISRPRRVASGCTKALRDSLVCAPHPAVSPPCRKLGPCGRARTG